MDAYEMFYLSFRKESRTENVDDRIKAAQKEALFWIMLWIQASLRTDKVEWK